MSLVDTSKVNDLSVRIQDLLTGLSPLEVKAVVDGVNTQLSGIGVTLQHVDDLADTAKTDLTQMAQAIVQLTALMTKAEAALDKIGSITGVQLTFREPNGT